jgi:hypothetical protein
MCKECQPKPGLTAEEQFLVMNYGEQALSLIRSQQKPPEPPTQTGEQETKKAA